MMRRLTMNLPARAGSTTLPSPPGRRDGDEGRDTTTGSFPPIAKHVPWRLSWRAFAFGVIVLAVCVLPYASAQTPQLPKRIGVVLVGHSPQDKVVQEFRQGLADAGHEVGKNVIIEWRSAAGNYERVPALIGGLIESKVDVIVVQTTFGVLAAKRPS
jgi:ABC transporter substrate binding protein